MQRRAREQVQHAADGADDDVAAGAQLGLLAADRGAAEDGDDVDALARAIGAQRLGDLDAQLARRGQDEGLDLAVGRIDVLDDGEAERGGLAGSGLRLPDDVLALEEDRDGLFLDGARLLVADILQGLKGRLTEAEVRKGGHVPKEGSAPWHHCAHRQDAGSANHSLPCSSVASTNSRTSKGC